ncbi:MAG: fatty acid desaturase [Cyanobacteriota bacterium]|nr:fatty acid desaturase [Cyanobacteriota bacterium]
MPADPNSPLIPVSHLARLNQRSDASGWRQVLGHGALIMICAAAWLDPSLSWALRLPALALLGVALAFGFCAMHECGHRTAFASCSLNDAVAWWAGVLSFYNADFYRRYHQWHHRHTHQPGLDPELEDSPPSTAAAYLLELSGLPWWLSKLRSHWRGIRGDFRGCPYIPASAAARVSGSIRLQFSVYALLLVLSLPAANGLLFWAWLLPLALGQPLLRFVLLAEHGGCSTSRDGLQNTRTTLTLPPLRWLMWNMSFHAEHHLFPSIPFHALAEAHRQLAPNLGEIAPGYLQLHQRFLRDPAVLAIPETSR